MPARTTAKHRRRPSEKELANLKPYPPGVSGNPAGRPSAGLSQREWFNTFANKANLTDAKLKRIIADEQAHPFKRAAAEQVLHQRMARMAHYERLVNGTATLQELEADGVDTSLVKKVKERRELDARGNVVAVTREVELHNVAGESFDRIANWTASKPTQSIEVTGLNTEFKVEWE